MFPLSPQLKLFEILFILLAKNNSRRRNAEPGGIVRSNSPAARRPWCGERP